MNSTDPGPELPPTTEPAGEPDDFKAMMTGATVIFVISLIPFANFTCCLPHLAGTLVALHLFTKQYQLSLTYGDGIKLGILTALLGGLAAWVVMVLLHMVFHYQPGTKEIKDLMLQFYTKYAPQAVDQIKEAFAKQETQGMTVGMIMIGLVSVVITSAIAGLIGGAIGTAWFKRGSKPGE